jgi:hypothetical protein
MAAKKAATASPCLLTPQGGGYFQATAGRLTLNNQDVTGVTVFNTSLSKVEDWTTTTHSPVTATLTTTSISFTMAAGRYYKVSLQCIQNPAFGSVAHLVEPCGRVATIIDITNVMPTLWIQA